jgi:hypothetical protein
MTSCLRKTRLRNDADEKRFGRHGDFSFKKENEATARHRGDMTPVGG